MPEPRPVRITAVDAVTRLWVRGATREDLVSALRAMLARRKTTDLFGQALPAAVVVLRTAGGLLSASRRDAWAYLPLLRSPLAVCLEQADAQDRARRAVPPVRTRATAHMAVAETIMLCRRLGPLAPETRLPWMAFFFSLFRALNTLGVDGVELEKELHNQDVIGAR